MNNKILARVRHASSWDVAVPIAAGITLLAIWGRPLDWVLIMLVSAALIGGVIVAVHHAEIIALRADDFSHDAGQVDALLFYKVPCIWCCLRYFCFWQSYHKRYAGSH